MKTGTGASEWLQLQWQLLRPYGRYLYYRLFPQRRPSYFSNSWTYPASRLDAPLEELPQLPEPDRPTFLFLPMNDWHVRAQRSQHLARAFAELGGQSIYVNPHLGLEYSKPCLADPHSRISCLEPGVFELHIHLSREHAFFTRPLRPRESQQVAGEIERAARKYGIQRAVSVISLPIWLDAAAQLRERMNIEILYDCHDWLQGFENIPPSVYSLEDRLLDTADIVTFSSQPLLDRMAAGRPGIKDRSLVVRNGVDPRYFALDRGTTVRPDSRSKTIGYVGALDSWFDIAAVERSAQDHPDWKFVLVGNVEHRAIQQRLHAYPNVEFAGEVPYDMVPRYLAEWDAAMIPFQLNQLTLAVNPIKVYEYFAMGLPVITTRLPEVELFQDLVYIADSPVRFSQLLDAAVRERDLVLRRQRMALAERETWIARAQTFLERLPVRDGVSSAQRA